MRKNKKKWYQKKGFWISVAIAAAALIAVGFFYVKRQAENARIAAIQNSVEHAEVTESTIVSTVSGSGHLAVADTVEITAPTGIKVKKVLVETGDTVKKGERLAELDEISLLDSLTEIDDEIDSIEDTLDDDDDLSDLRIEELKLQKEELEEYREQLSSLKEHPYLISAADGVIDELYLSAGSEITRTQTSSGTSAGSSTDVSSLSSIGYGLTSYDAGAAQAASSLKYNTSAKGGKRGIVLLSDVEDGNASGDGGTGNDGSDSSGTGNDGSDGSGTGNNGSDDSKTGTDGSDTSGTGTGGSGADDPSRNDSPDQKNQDTQITDFSKFRIETPVTGSAPQNEIAETDTYTGTIRWTPESDIFAAETAYTATCVLTAKDGYTFSGLTLTDLASGWSYVTGNDGKTLTVTAEFPKTEAASAAADSTPSTADNPASPADAASGNNTGGMPSTDATSGNNTYSLPSTDSTSGTAGYSIPSSAASAGSSYSASLGSASSLLSGSTASGVSGEITGTASSYYSNYETTVCVVRKEDSFALEVSIDELDILSVEKGQEAEITIDALSGQTFTGTISEVAESADSGTGSAKYTVSIRIPANDDMRLGMSASAEIEVAKAEDILTIPMLALQQSGDQMFVYTQQNEDGTLSGIQNVETGVSDGDYVEISEGLSEGDTVYYLRSGEDASGNFFDENNPFENGGSGDDTEDGGET